MPLLPTIQPQRLYDLFRDLVDIYSPSGKEEQIIGYLTDYLDQSGFQLEQQLVSDTRYNLVVQAAPQTEPRLLLMGHVDTVHAYDYEDYEFSEQDGIISGLGTADMKGGCAALVEALISARQADVDLSGVVLALVVGEEENGDGTQALLEELVCPWALVAEPTDLQPALSHCGYMEMLLRTFGQRGHASLAEREDNAVYSMLGVLLQLTEAVDKEFPDVTLNIRDMNSSESGFAVPDHCSASVDFHLPPEADPEDCAEAIRQLLGGTLAETKVELYSMEFKTLDRGFCLDSDGVLPLYLRQVFESQQRRWKPTTFRSHSDANLLYRAGCQPVILGPGQLAKAHTRDESVAFEQVVAAAETYAGLLSHPTPEFVTSESRQTP